MADRGIFLGHSRRRSVDNGGLRLAAETEGSGHGWGGWEEKDLADLEPGFAELLGDMYSQTLSAVNEHGTDFPASYISSETRGLLIESLASWNFEPHKLPEEHVLSCTLLLFEALFRVEGMQQDVGVSLHEISTFLHHLRRIYRWENSYHNFEHAVDVLQASQMFLRSAGMVPPLTILLEDSNQVWRPVHAHDDGSLITCLGNMELFAVYIAAIGHDVGHPGFTNLFMKNAQAPLCVVYDDRSPLEQMHSYLLLKLLRQHGMGTLLDNPIRGSHFRKLLWETVLATDMSVHATFMARFQSLITPELAPISHRQVLTCQAIIKCADISNPSRPHMVSQYWASALMDEWSSQALLEKRFDLPSTVKPSHDRLSEARSQVWFITNFVQPLLNLASSSQGIPEMAEYAILCATNLRIWQKICDEHDSKDTDSADVPAPPPSARQPDDFSTIFPLTLPPSARGPNFDTPGWPSMYHPPSSSPGYSAELDRRTETASSYQPSSPTTSLDGSSESLPFSPQSDWSNFNHCPPSCPPSSAGASKTDTMQNSDGQAIRAVFDAGVRKRKTDHRFSWNEGLVAKSMSLKTTSSRLRDTSPLDIFLPASKLVDECAILSSDTIVVTTPNRNCAKIP